MAIYFSTPMPKKLIATFKNAIDTELITSWTYDKDGDFTHTSKQWINKAWLHPEIDADQLCLYTVAPKNGEISQQVYAEFQSSFLEAMMLHCFTLFSQGIATAVPADRDSVKCKTHKNSLPDSTLDGYLG